jgi:putative hydrolase of the HAD superfamily
MAQSRLASIISLKRAVIFDLFHTLTALESTWSAGLTTSEMLGFSKEAWNEQLSEKSPARLTGEERDPFTIVRHMVHAIDPHIPDELIEKAVQNRIERFAGALIGIPATTREVLLKLKQSQKRIGLVSNADVMEIAAWAQSPICHLFDSAIFSCEVGCIKPERAIYKIALRSLRVKLEDAVFDGDGGARELEGAKAVGLTTVMMAGMIRKIWPEKIEERKRFADYVVESLDELCN